MAFVASRREPQRHKLRLAIDRRRRGDLATAELRLAAWTSEPGTLWGGTIVIVPGINMTLLIESKEAR